MASCTTCKADFDVKELQLIIWLLWKRYSKALVAKQHTLRVFFDSEAAYDRCWKYGALCDLHRLGIHCRLPISSPTSSRIAASKCASVCTSVTGFHKMKASHKGLCSLFFFSSCKWMASSVFCLITHGAFLHHCMLTTSQSQCVHAILPPLKKRCKTLSITSTDGQGRMA